MTLSDHTVTRLTTTHTAEDTTGTNVEIITDQLQLEPFLNGAAFRTQIFTHLAGPATSEHMIDRDGIDRANNLTNHVYPENGVSSCVMDMAPGVKIDQHRTESIDHIAILSGSVLMKYPENGLEKTVEIKAGDVLVQRGTTHGWEAGPQGVRFFTVMVHAKPVVVKETGTELTEFW